MQEVKGKWTNIWSLREAETSKVLGDVKIYGNLQEYKDGRNLEKENINEPNEVLRHLKLDEDLRHE